MMLSPSDTSQIVELLQKEFPEVQAIYLFGSQVTDYANESSDVDLAIYTGSNLSNEQVWECKFKLAERVNKEVDLIDLYDATTVLQFEVISTGERLFFANNGIEWFESKVYWNYLTLNEDRRLILEDIAKTGKIHG